MKRNEQLDREMAHFVNTHAVACGGDWCAMAMSAIRYGIPHVFAKLDREKIYHFKELFDIIADYVSLPFIYLDDLKEQTKFFDLPEPPPTSPEDEAFWAQAYHEMIHEEYSGEQLKAKEQHDQLGWGATTMQAQCREGGHKMLHDCSEAGPDSGNMDHECLWCGEHFHVQLY